jgi:hypothetical protein
MGMGFPLQVLLSRVGYVAFGVEQISQTGARGFVFVYVQAGHVHGPSAVDKGEEEEEEEDDKDGGRSQ